MGGVQGGVRRAGEAPPPLCPPRLIGMCHRYAGDSAPHLTANSPRTSPWHPPYPPLVMAGTGRVPNTGCVGVLRPRHAPCPPLRGRSGEGELLGMGGGAEAKPLPALFSPASLHLLLSGSFHLKEGMCLEGKFENCWFQPPAPPHAWSFSQSLCPALGGRPHPSAPAPLGPSRTGGLAVPGMLESVSCPEPRPRACRALPAPRSSPHPHTTEQLSPPLPAAPTHISKMFL